MFLVAHKVDVPESPMICRMRENSSRFVDIARERRDRCLRRGPAARWMYREPQGYLAYCGHAGLLESANPADETFCQRLGFESLEVVCAGDPPPMYSVLRPSC
jgi:hypothetical protein